jgi:hypothetical protein
MRSQTNIEIDNKNNDTIRRPARRRNTTTPSDDQPTPDHIDTDTTRRRRRRRPRRGGKKQASTSWFDFAPHVTDSDGNVFLAHDELGYPVKLPSGQGVYLLHEAMNPEFAATFLPEDKLRSSPFTTTSSFSSSAQEEEEDKFECSSTSCSTGSLTDDEADDETQPTISFPNLSFEQSINCNANLIDHDVEGDFADSASACSDLSSFSSSLGMGGGCFRAHRSDSSESGVTSCSAHSSDDFSSSVFSSVVVGSSLGADDDSLSSSSLDSNSSRSLCAWKSFHGCIDDVATHVTESNVDDGSSCSSSFAPSKLPAGRRSSKLAAAAQRFSSSSSSAAVAPTDGSSSACAGSGIWGGLNVVDMSPPTTQSSFFGLGLALSSAPALIDDVESRALVNRLICDEDEKNDGDDEVVLSSDALESPCQSIVVCANRAASAEKKEKKEKKEARRVAKTVEAETKAKVEREARRAAHEMRTKRNQTKAERRRLKAKAGKAPLEDEVDAAMRELGLLGPNETTTAPAL